MGSGPNFSAAKKFGPDPNFSGHDLVDLDDDASGVVGDRPARALQVAGLGLGVAGSGNARGDDNAREGGNVHAGRHRHRVVERELEGQLARLAAQDRERYRRAFGGARENEEGVVRREPVAQFLRELHGAADAGMRRAVGLGDRGSGGSAGAAARLGDVLLDLARVFGVETPCSSTKPLVGHALGAAGATEAGFCWLALAAARDGELPLIPHRWDGVRDRETPAVDLIDAGRRAPFRGRPLVATNSFGFGGNNCVLILGGEG